MEEEECEHREEDGEEHAEVVLSPPHGRPPVR
jgi:hypothetical protein